MVKMDLDTFCGGAWRALLKKELISSFVLKMLFSYRKLLLQKAAEQIVPISSHEKVSIPDREKYHLPVWHDRPVIAT